MQESTTKFVRVWDPLIRIGHWTLVASFFIAYFTEDEWLTTHVWAGYILGVVILLRIAWGFIGTRHARFNDFLKSPTTIFDYLKSLHEGPVKHYVGHNPAGGIMIVLMLICLSITVYTGLELYAIEENAGPLASLNQPINRVTVGTVFSPVVSVRKKSSHDDNEHSKEDKNAEVNSKNHEDAEEFWEELHEFFANLTLLLIILHVAGVVVSSRLHNENLVKAMLTGNKLRRSVNRSD